MLRLNQGDSETLWWSLMLIWRRRIFTQNIFSGSTNVRSGSNFPNQGGQLSGVDEILVHPDYNPTNRRSNIALLRLNSPVSFTEMAINSQDLTPGDEVTLTGWNTLVPFLPIFKEATSEVLSSAECSRRLGRIFSSALSCDVGTPPSLLDNGKLRIPVKYASKLYPFRYI